MAVWSPVWTTFGLPLHRLIRTDGSPAKVKPNIWEFDITSWEFLPYSVLQLLFFFKAKPPLAMAFASYPRDGPAPLLVSVPCPFYCSVPPAANILIFLCPPVFSPPSPMQYPQQHNQYYITPNTQHAPIPNQMHNYTTSPTRNEPPQRKRPKYTRSKTGCLTCRAKKIKVCLSLRPRLFNAYSLVE